MKRFLAMCATIILLFTSSLALTAETVTNGFSLSVEDGSNQETTTIKLESLSDYDKVTIQLPDGLEYDDSLSKDLDQQGVEFSYKKSDHVLELNWNEGVKQNTRFVLTNLSNTDNNLLIRGFVSDEIVAEESHSFRVTAAKTDTDGENQKPKITPFAGNLNVDIDISAQNSEILSGNDAAFKLVFKTTGSMKSYTNAKIVVELPNSKYAHFNQNIDDLKIAGVIPTYSDNQLIYEFDTLKTGQTYENIIKLETENGMTPDGTEFDVNVSFEADNQEIIEDNASSNITASSPISVSKQFTTLHNEDSQIPLPNTDTVWKIKTDIPKSKIGQLYLEEDSQIKIVDELPEGLTYHSVLQGPEPVQEDNKLTWTYDAPSVEEQIDADNSLFNTEIEVVLTTGRNTADDDLENKVEVEATFIDDNEQKSDASHSIKVFESDPTSGEIEGTVYVPNHIGPIDGKGNRGNNDNKNPEPVVYDDAILSFDHGIAPLHESKEGDFEKYTTTYEIDEHLIFKELRTPGGFVYRPGGSHPAGVPLKKDPIFNIEATIDGEHKVLVEDADVGTFYTRDDLGIDSNARVDNILLNFTYAPSGMLNNGRPQYYFEVEPDYVGDVKNTFNVHGISGNGTNFSYDYHEEGLNHIAGPRTAKIAEKPTDQPPTATVGVELTDHTGSYIETGNNRMQVTLKTENSSTLAMTEPLNSVVLLPPGIKIADTPDVAFIDADGNSTSDTNAAMDGDYEILSDDHNGSGRQLVKFNWNDHLLRPGYNVQAYIDVVIDEEAPNTLTFDVYGFSGDEELSVPDVDEPGLTDTILQTDDDDLNEDGSNEQPRLKSGNRYYMSGQYNIQTEKLVKGELDDDFSYFGKTIPGGIIDYKLTLTNTIGKDISNMVLIDVLPAENDLGITDNVERGSQFTPSLKESIQLPDSWENRVDVYYSTALTPERDDLIKNTKYPETTEKLSNPDGAESPNWMLEEDVNVWSSIRSFKLELKEGISWIHGEDITIQFTMDAPAFDEIDESLVAKETDPKVRAAWNSFAIATDEGQPIEPLRVGVYMELDNTVELEKKGEDGKNLEGAVFELQDANGNTLQDDLKTGSDGKLIVNDLMPGKYQFVETSAPEGYELDDKPIEFEITSPLEKIELTFENPLNTGSVELIKVNENGETLEGAVFELQDEHGMVLEENLITDEDGKLLVEDLKPGKYQFLETEAPFGYKLDDTSLPFEIVFNQQETLEIEFENAYTPGTFELTKEGENGDLLEGVTFELQNENGDTLREELVTDEDGILTIEDLEPGNYQLMETATIDGYDLIDEPIPFEIGLGQDDKTEVTFENPLSTGSIELIKVNENGETLEDAVFELQDENGNTLEEDLTTDQDGKLLVEDLKPGKYQFVEIEAPFGYTLDDTPLPFEIVFNQQETLEIEFVNAYTPGTFELTKVGEDGELLEGVTFELQDENGDTLREELVTDEDGILTIEDLDPGNYKLIETATIDGYDLIDEPIPFEIGLGQDDKTEVIFENPLSTGSVELIKVNENGETLEGAVFELQDEHGMTLEENLITDEDGKLLVEDLKPGKYQFVEIEAPIGYELDDTPLEFEIVFNQQETIEIEVENSYTPGTFELTKKGEDGDLLEGVTFELQDENGDTLREELVTDEDGILTIEDLEPGNYQLMETATIDGYDLIDEPIPFEIGLGQDDKTEVTFENPLSTGSVELIKVNEDDETLDGAVFELRDENGKTLEEKLTTDQDGKLLVEDLKPGKYQFIETEAPIGYELDDTPHEFEIVFDQRETLEIHIKNTLIVKTISGEKKWNDNNDATGDRPASIIVQVLDGNKLVDEKIVNSEDDWRYTFKDLPKYDGEGNEIVYTINELPVAGYSVQYDGFDTINTRTDKINVEGTKYWEDDNSATRPDSITVHLLANGHKVNSIVVSKDTNWSYAFDDLEAYDDQGKAISYSVEEEPVKGYKTIINGYDITNLRVGETSIKVQKKWENDTSDSRPEFITVDLLQNGIVIETMKISKNSNWIYTFENLDKFDKDGKRFDYSVQEHKIELYETDIKRTDEGFQITNSLLEKEVSDKDENSLLPKTATDNFNLILIGLIIIVFGIVVLLISQKRNRL